MSHSSPVVWLCVSKDPIIRVFSGGFIWNIAITQQFLCSNLTMGGFERTIGCDGARHASKRDLFEGVEEGRGSCHRVGDQGVYSGTVSCSNLQKGRHEREERVSNGLSNFQGF